jgi:hypothetical protein
MNARRYCVVIALAGVAGCVGDLMAADTLILAALSQTGLGHLEDQR